MTWPLFYPRQSWILRLEHTTRKQFLWNGGGYEFKRSNDALQKLLLKGMHMWQFCWGESCQEVEEVEFSWQSWDPVPGERLWTWSLSLWYGFCSLPPGVEAGIGCGPWSRVTVEQWPSHAWRFPWFKESPVNFVRFSVAANRLLLGQLCAVNKRKTILQEVVTLRDWCLSCSKTSQKFS